MSPRYFFSGDHHFWHKNIILEDYENRPFWKEDEPDVEAMNENMIEGWNKVVQPSDVVCYVGDISFGGYKKTSKILSRLNGKLLYVRGNHDDKSVLRALEESGKLIAPVTYLKELVIESQHIVLSHCAHKIWFRSHYGSWNIFGHSHGNLTEEGKQLDVGVDAIAKRGLGYVPVPFEYIRGILDSRKRVHHDHHR